MSNHADRLAYLRANTLYEPPPCDSERSEGASAPSIEDRFRHAHDVDGFPPPDPWADFATVAVVIVGAVAIVIASLRGWL